MLKKVRVMIVAGEASGDAHAAKLIQRLRVSVGDDGFEAFGAAGPMMRKAGVEAIVRSDELSVVGIPEILKAAPMFISALRELTAAASEREPDVVVLVDFPDFNLRLARSLKKKGFRVIYYISPQLWAWRSYRVRSIRKYVDLLITILPFEKDWYSKKGITHVEYVGSPLALEVHPQQAKEEFCDKNGIDPTRPIVAFLPGSRHKEIIRILPVMLEAAALMSQKRDEIQFVIGLAPGRTMDEVSAARENLVAKGVELPEFRTTINETYDLLNASDAAAVTSGTATLETGILGTPMAIVYKTSAFNYKLLRPLISVEHFGLINLIAGERISRELIQDEFTPGSLAGELARLLDPEANQFARRQLAKASDMLGHGGASKRAADAILSFLDK
jgi:lipid-A-disaccharide synthase